MVDNYYYIIVGGGLAGLQLALDFKRDIFFKGKDIAIIDPSLKTENDKTWCFWEKGKGKWEEIIHKQWENATFISSSAHQNLKLHPYKYKMIKSLDFYSSVKQELESSSDIHFIKDEISLIDPVIMQATGKEKAYMATHFFDSRIPRQYFETRDYTKIFQHFKGWTIESNNPQFDPSQFTMMDYRLKYKDTTSFGYVLPITANKALVEFTFFTPSLNGQEVYDEMLKRYISEYLLINDYKIIETETGIIPMTDFPFHTKNTNKITKIGTGGGWVKASTGYSFKNTEKKVEKIIRNIKKGVLPGDHILNEKFRKYDTIFLDVLATNNHLGEEIFTKFYTKNSPEEIFKYLDEETSVSEDLKIMLSLYRFSFIKSFFKKIL